jgi:hypothetical protein
LTLDFSSTETLDAGAVATATKAAEGAIAAGCCSSAPMLRMIRRLLFRIGAPSDSSFIASSNFCSTATALLTLTAAVFNAAGGAAMAVEAEAPRPGAPTLDGAVPGVASGARSSGIANGTLFIRFFFVMCWRAVGAREKKIERRKAEELFFFPSQRHSTANEQKI